jgi:hypothetical protein
MSSDYERIEQVADKLGHALMDIRRRASQNLLSKVENGIINAAVLSTRHCADVLAGGVGACVERLCAEWGRWGTGGGGGGVDEEAATEVLMNVLKMLRHLGTHAPGCLAAAAFTHVVSALERLSSIDSVGSATNQLIEEVRVCCLMFIGFVAHPLTVHRASRRLTTHKGRTLPRGGHHRHKARDAARPRPS